MLPIVQQLLRLQERDQKIRALQRELKDLPKVRQRAEERLADDDGAVASAKQKRMDIEVKIKSLELDIQTRRTTIARLKDQQFNTRKNEEFQAMAHEVKRYENEVTALEDKELEFMEQIEALKPEAAAAHEKAAETKKNVERELALIAERGKNLEARLAEITAEREALAAPIEPGPMGVYNRLLKSKGDAAIVPLTGFICGGCHMKVVIGTLNNAKSGEEMTYCEQCGRVLYVEE